MNHRLHFSEEAKKDVLDIFAWYEDIKTGLGKRFKKQLTISTAHLRKEPHTIQIKYADVRIIFLKIFPYGIHFQIVGNEVFVIAVLHTSRKPRA
ncbi:MAG: type II toxin-antitoxin system RelE/ParE family toxin [Flavobacteriales bacterium]|nr:type II toxin-antitoxin system RelE/ParE family toxin [Flavobacteriales bacterium]